LISILLPPLSKFPPGGYLVVYDYAKHCPTQVQLVHQEEWSFQQKSFREKALGMVFVRNLYFLYKKYQLLKNRPDLNILNIVPRFSKSKVDKGKWIATSWQTFTILKKVNPIYFVQHFEIWDGNKSEVLKTYVDAKKIITISPWIVTQINRSDSVLIPNGTWIKQFSTKKALLNTPTIGFIYRPDSPFKGVAFFQKILPQLKALNTNIIIAGYQDPHWLDVHYLNTPNAQKMETFYERIDFLIYPSESEGFGLPILEAMQKGVVVLTTPVGIAEALIDHGQNGYIIDSSFNSIRQCLEQGIPNFIALSSKAQAKTKNMSVAEQAQKFWEQCKAWD
jgi:glycosyltransferase involved in cell wall biosynthesis